MSFLRACLVFVLLLAVKAASRMFFRPRIEWVPSRPRWSRVRVLAALNHTSLYEPVYAAGMPVGFLWRIARHGCLPVADKTLRRPGVGLFFKLLAQHVVVVSRQADETWARLMGLIGPKSMVVIFPEGRMKRESGLDADGNPMTVRGGIADIIRSVSDGELAVAYLGGLHHVQKPGDLLPRPFKTIRAVVERLDVAEYSRLILERAGDEGFKRAVIADLQERRDRHCPSLVSGREEPDAAAQPAES